MSLQRSSNNGIVADNILSAFNNTVINTNILLSERVYKKIGKIIIDDTINEYKKNFTLSNVNKLHLQFREVSLNYRINRYEDR